MELLNEGHLMQFRGMPWQELGNFVIWNLKNFFLHTPCSYAVQRQQLGNFVIWNLTVSGQSAWGIVFLGSVEASMDSSFGLVEAS